MTPIALFSFLKCDFRGKMNGAVNPIEMYESIKSDCILLFEKD